MKKKHILVNSFLDSFTAIWKNKSTFLVLFLLQIIFFWLLFSTSVKYQTRILENTQAISDYLSKQQFDEISIAQNIMQQKDVLGDDPLIISKYFNEIVKNFRIYLILIFMYLVLFTSLAWTITFSLIYKKNFLSLAKNFFRNIIVLSFYLGLIFSFFYSLFNISLAQAAETGIFTKYVPFLIATPILYYFMLVSLSLPYTIGLREILQKTLHVGIKKVHYVLFVYLIIIILLFIPLTLLYYFFEENLLILILSIILTIFIFVFGRVFMVNVVERLKNL